jgi:hypothetical protein
MKPIRPSQVQERKVEIPDVVIECVNKMIQSEWSGFQSKIYQKDLVNKIIESSVFTREEIFAKHYLDFEYLYKKAGWKVVYDKPAYNEDYEAYFVFSKKE